MHLIYVLWPNADMDGILAVGGQSLEPQAGSQPWAQTQGLQNWGTPESSSLFYQVSPPSPSAERCNLRVQLRQVGSPPALSAETLVRLR